jgi:hypothetical protein
MDAFQHSFNLDKNSPDFSSLQGNIVSVLQVCLRELHVNDCVTNMA